MSLETRNRLSDEEALELRAWTAEVGGNVTVVMRCQYFFDLFLRSW